MALIDKSGNYYRLLDVKKHENVKGAILVFMVYKNKTARDFEKSTEEDWNIFVKNCENKISEFLYALDIQSMPEDFIEARRKFARLIKLLEDQEEEERLFKKYFSDRIVFKENIEKMYKDGEFEKIIEKVYVFKEAFKKSAEARKDSRVFLTDAEIKMLIPYGYNIDWKGKCIETHIEEFSNYELDINFLDFDIKDSYIKFSKSTKMINDEQWELQ